MAKRPGIKMAQFAYGGMYGAKGKSPYFQGYGYTGEASYYRGNKSDPASLSAALVNIEVRYQQARVELFQLLKDLWYAIVRNTAWLSPMAPLRTIFADTNKDGVIVGWERYPGKDTSESAIGHDERFRVRKEMMHLGTVEVLQQLFSLGRDTLRSDVAKLRVALSQGGAPIDYTPMSTVPQYVAAGMPEGRADAGVNVPIRSGQRKDTTREVLQPGMRQSRKRGPRGPYRKRS